MNALAVLLALACALLAAPMVTAEPEPAPAAQGCSFGGLPHPGFDCTVAGVHCAFFIWVDLNPPNPTFDCLT